MALDEPFLGGNRKSPYRFLSCFDNAETSCLADAGNLIMRFVVASLLFHHGQDKIVNDEKFTTGTVEKYFVPLG